MVGAVDGVDDGIWVRCPDVIDGLSDESTVSFERCHDDSSSLMTSLIKVSVLFDIPLDLDDFHGVLAGLGIG